jgi:predicted AAA+ superfamily ATPase
MVAGRGDFRLTRMATRCLQGVVRLGNQSARPPGCSALWRSADRQDHADVAGRRCLLREGVPPANILYVTFDHPILKLAGIDAVLEAWREREPKVDGPEYLFLDEAQFIRDWGTWVKHQVDFAKHRRIAFTGSAMPLVEAGQESGVGRWHTIRLTTLSFYEYLQIKNLSLPALPRIKSLRDLFDWPQSDFYRVTEAAAPYVGHFHEYLVRGGFPQTAQVEASPRHSACCARTSSTRC